MYFCIFKHFSYGETVILFNLFKQEFCTFTGLFPLNPSCHTTESIGIYLFIIFLWHV